MKKLLTVFLLMTNIVLARDLTLDQAIDLSLNNSKEMKISEKNLDISKLNVNKAFKNALPSVTYTGAYTVGEHERQILTQSEKNYVSKKRGYTQNLKLTQPLFTGGVVTAGIKGAKAYENIASYTYLQSKIKNRLDTIKIFSDIINAQRNLEALSYSEGILLKRYQKQEEQLKLRLITKPDILQTEYSIEDIRAQMINIKNVIDTNMEKLYIRTGINKSEPLNLVPFNIPNNFSEKINLNSDLKQAIDESLSAKIAEEQVKIASATRMAAVGELLPQVSAFASYGTGERTSFERSYKDAEWTGGVQVSWKLFSFGSDLDNYRVAKLQEEQEELRENSAKENIEINVRSAYLNVLSLEKQVAAQRKAVEAAKSNFEMNQEKYDAGLISTIDYLDFENTYRQARIAYNKVLLDYYYAFETYRSLLI
ncbi:TolC family protein [Fusobacterium hwasookii]|uniref:Outer membrane protein TolC n=1 Tax=Fusobacterium hwasookii ChDC F128 TaxID=1216362 RepID=A0ABP2R5D1_9FUSO|nr:TolC family protein [Fusobacterium hwasookii]EJU07324.1 outer membrane protein TolC [Fusobacterium hwasookii ChDC F128]QNE65659.1 TolC family protein [Fusobacterium hwasookii]